MVAQSGPSTLPGARSWMSDALRVTRAAMTNQLARAAPGAYLRLTRQTGRGAAAEENPSDIASYFQDSVDAYFEQLKIAPGERPAFLRGKTLMEYGPGDLPGVAALMVARGADKVFCVDRFPLVSLSEKNRGVLRQLLDRSQGTERERLSSCFVGGDPAAGFDPRRIEYLVQPSGLSGLQAQVDLVFSRAVLEHVDDLQATLADMLAAMKPGATAVHLVDLRSHGLHQDNPLDFLAWAPAVWQLMYSHKGVPNRWRIDKYRAIVNALGVDAPTLHVTKLAAVADVEAVRPQLAAMFQGISDADLGCLGFWLTFRKRQDERQGRSQEAAA